MATAVQPLGGLLYQGTARGLIRWELVDGKPGAATPVLGLPGEQIQALANDGQNGLWVVTTKGVAHQAVQKGKSGWLNFPPASVGPFVTGAASADDGSFWVGGPEGLARLPLGSTKWTHLLGDTSVTAVEALGDAVWVGTSGRGVLRIRGDQVEVFSSDQGCETEVVRGLVATPGGVMAIGELTDGGARVAFYAGQRFWSYRVDGPKESVLEWVKRVGDHVRVGAGGRVYQLDRLAAAESAPASGAPLAVVAQEAKPVDPPPTGSAVGSPPVKVIAKPVPKPVVVPPLDKPGVAMKPVAAAGKKPLGKKSEEEEEEETPAPPVAKPAAPEVKPEPPAPKWRLSPWGPPLPDAVSAVGVFGDQLFIGTRFLGAARVEEKGLDYFRNYDLARDAVRLTVACPSESSCYVATGTERAWHYDGQSFSSIEIDPEKGSRVLAMLDPPRGSTIAIHRGVKDPLLRVSAVSNEGVWAPIAGLELKVPAGVPEITFATFAPDRHLWVGLRYLDVDGDRVDYGAAEVDLDSNGVVYHRTARTLGPKSLQLPNDLESIFFVGPKEIWFGSRRGAVHAQAGKLDLYTENDGLESEYIHDILTGSDGKLWVATSRGVGRFDGIRWSFPQEEDPLHVRASALAKDRAGGIVVGTSRGLLLCQAPPSGAPPGIKIDQVGVAQGLIDDAVLDLAVDQTGRMWALTEKGISIITR